MANLVYGRVYDSHTVRSLSKKDLSSSLIAASRPDHFLHSILLLRRLGRSPKPLSLSFDLHPSWILRTGLTTASSGRFVVPPLFVLSSQTRLTLSLFPPCPYFQGCYVQAFRVTTTATVLALALSLFAGWRREKASRERKRRASMLVVGSAA